MVWSTIDNISLNTVRCLWQKAMRDLDFMNVRIQATWPLLIKYKCFWSMLEFSLTFDYGITHFLDLCGMDGSRYFSKHRRIPDLSSGSDIVLEVYRGCMSQSFTWKWPSIFLKLRKATWHNAVMILIFYLVCLWGWTQKGKFEGCLWD